MQVKKAAIVPLIALTTVAVVLTVVTAAVLTSQSLPSTGTITPTPSGNGQNGGGSNGGGGGGITTNNANLAVFSDQNATLALSNVDWGALTPGSMATKTIYVKNTGNVAEKLSLTATAWTPESASSVLTLSWDREGTTLASGTTVAATLTLTVADNTGDLTSFDLNIVVSGSV